MLFITHSKYLFGLQTGALPASTATTVSCRQIILEHLRKSITNCNENSHLPSRAKVKPNQKKTSARVEIFHIASDNNKIIINIQQYQH